MHKYKPENDATNEHAVINHDVAVKPLSLVLCFMRPVMSKTLAKIKNTDEIIAIITTRFNISGLLKTFTLTLHCKVDFLVHNLFNAIGSERSIHGISKKHFNLFFV